jgi:hypothetical protein
MMRFVAHSNRTQIEADFYAEKESYTTADYRRFGQNPQF